MKRKITSLATLLLIFTTLISCKKEDTDSQKYKMTGRWQVSKIETKIGSQTIIDNYTSTDYMDFKNNTEDEVEVKLGNTTTKGNYLVMIDGTFNLSIDNKLYYCTTNNLSDTNFQFTAVADKSDTQTTKTYYLVR